MDPIDPVEASFAASNRNFGQRGYLKMGQNGFFCYICLKIQYKRLQMVGTSILNTLMYCQTYELIIKVLLIKFEIDQIM